MAILLIFIDTFLLFSWDKNNFLIYRIIGNVINFLMLKTTMSMKGAKSQAAF